MGVRHERPFALAALLAAAGALLAQTPATRPAYEVASVKANVSDSGHNGTDDTKGTVMYTNMPLQRLIAQAYQVSPFQVAGPDWLAATRFDIVARYSPGVKDEVHPLMLRTLLEDRFHLAVHHETKEMSGYSMVIAKSGFKLKPAEPGDDSTEHTGGRIQSLDAKRATMDRLASLVSRYLGVAVDNNTNLDGVYDFQIRWITDEAAARTPETQDIPTLPAILEEKLGIHLQARKIPVDLIVVDRVDRVPVEN